MRISILGPGRVGLGFWQLIDKHPQLNAELLFGRQARPPFSEPRYRTWPPDSNDLQALVDNTDLLLFCISDDALSEVLQTFAQQSRRLPPSSRNTLAVAHTSGLHACTELLPEHPWRYFGGLHPLCALPDAGTATRLLSQCYYSIESAPEHHSDDTHSLLIRFVNILGANYGYIPPRLKGAYHAAAVLCSSLSLALVDQAAGIVSANQTLSLEPATVLDAMLDLAIGALQHAKSDSYPTASAEKKTGLAKALTGPIRRGDAQTLQTHLDALEPYPALHNHYRTLSAYVLEKLGDSLSDSEKLVEVLKG